MNREQKAGAIAEVAAMIEEADAIFAVDYRGLSVRQAAELRRRLADADATLRVVKNRLTQRAADQAGAEQLKPLLVGPTAFAFVRGDVALAAKALAGFRREAPTLAFKGGTMNGDALTVEQVESIARLPTREVLQGQFVGVLASPLSGLARGLSALLSGLAVALRQIEERGLVGGGASTEAVPGGPAPAGDAASAEGPPETGQQTETEPQ